MEKAFLLLVAVLLLVSCGKDPDTNPTPEPLPVDCNIYAAETNVDDWTDFSQCYGNDLYPDTTWVQFKDTANWNLFNCYTRQNYSYKPVLVTHDEIRRVGTISPIRFNRLYGKLGAPKVTTSIILLDARKKFWP